jgi:phage terminase large subunit-like protein
MIVKDKFNERTLYEFTEQEYLEYLYNEGRCNIKYIDDKPRGELVLIIGRRGTKSTISSWVAAYETYKLLKTYHPQKFYGLLPDTEIHLTCLATSEDQANLLFRQVLGHFANSTYFHRYMNKPTTDKVYIRSRRDLEKYGDEGKSSLIVRSAPCSARGIRGTGNVLVIMDEQAHFVDEKAQSNKSDKAVYDAVTPSVAQFGTDGKIINISSPLNKSGVLWDLYNSALDGSDNILMIQAPSWEINNTLSSDFLKGRYHQDPITYECEFGGQFSDRVKAWIPEEYIRKIIDPSLKPKTNGIPRLPYFMGVDVGFKEDGTAIAVSHVEKHQDDNGNLVDKIEIDYVGRRSAGVYPYEDRDVLDFEEIAEWIKEICDRFFVVKGLLDQHNGYVVAQNLAKKGMNQFDLIFHTRNFNSKLYQNFMMLAIDNKIRLFNDKDENSGGIVKDGPLIEELLKLQVTQHSKNIISVQAPRLKGHHDDMSDALMRSVWMAAEAIKAGLVSGKELSTINNRYSSVRDMNQYQLRKQRFHNIQDNRRNVRKRRMNSWVNKYGR